ncbi:MAG: PLP-dependent aminotransferase family protein [Thermodesulfobacteriota bacterium]
MLSNLIQQQSGAKYVRIAAGIELAVKKGVLQSGDALPPQRELADQLGVTLGTVSRGYGEAEKRGLIRGETGRGTFVRLQEHDQFSLHSLHNQPDRDSMSVIQFDLNFPVQHGSPDISGALKQLAQRHDLAELLDYRPSSGLMRHRKIAAAWLKNLGMDGTPEQIAVCGGVQHGLQIVLMSQFKAGETLAVEQYSYPGLINLAAHHGIRLVPVAMDGWGLRPDSLQAIARQQRLKGIYLMPTLQNPTAVTMPAKRRLELASVIKKLDICLIEDDVYGALADECQQPISAHIPERSFYLTSLSKILAPGLRVGFLRMPDESAAMVEAAMAASIWLIPPLMAEIGTQWIDDGTATQVAQIKKLEATRRCDLIREHLTSIPIRSNKGSHHLWLQLPPGWQGESFARRAASKGVAVIPSVNFSASAHPEHQAIRLCIGPPKSDEELIHGAGLLNEILSQATVQNLL